MVHIDENDVAIHPRRASEKVMRLERLGSFHQSRLSFMRILLRRAHAEKWTFARSIFEIDELGVGYAVYEAHLADRIYSLVVFSHNLPDELRSDRVIAEAWDSTFTLFDGVPSQDDIERLCQNVPLQEAGRISETELTLSRANRSVRLWQHVVEKLSSGEQPDLEMIEDVGYLMRTTAVYGSGKFGAADRQSIEMRPEFQAPFQVEMLTVYLKRAFVRDLVEHMARTKGGDKAVPLSYEIARKIGIGNSTGLGMAPFILNHPVLFNNWIMAREEAISRVCCLSDANESDVQLFIDIFNRARLSIAQWTSSHPLQIEKLSALNEDIDVLVDQLTGFNWKNAYPWSRLINWSEANLRMDAQELLASLILEPYGALVDGLSECMSDVSDKERIHGQRKLAELRRDIEHHYDWALSIDWAATENDARVWYVSQEKLEPRLGERYSEPIANFEQPLSPARDVALLYDALESEDDQQSIASFLINHPEHRHAVQRIQVTSRLPYAEIRDNTIASNLLPIDMLRCKLSFFGATHFDPRSDRWVRICMFANAPYPNELSSSNADFWPYPKPNLKVD